MSEELRRTVEEVRRELEGLLSEHDKAALNAVDVALSIVEGCLSNSGAEVPVLFKPWGVEVVLVPSYEVYSFHLERRENIDYHYVREAVASRAQDIVRRCAALLASILRGAVDRVLRLESRISDLEARLEDDP